MEIRKVENASLYIFDSAGTGHLLPVIFDSLKTRPIRSRGFARWVGRFNGNHIGKYVHFQVRPDQNRVVFYCTWKAGKMAEINYKTNNGST